MIDSSQMSVKEINAAIVDVQSKCDGVRLSPDYELMSLNKARALRLIEMGACCGRQEPLTVESHDGEGRFIDRKTIVYCHYTDKPCERATIGHLVYLFSFLNSERVLHVNSIK